ncbi:uncharacterized protein EI90DRAFT_1257028 [Cantharellus anzutake]|uniref:uncharacterized protein n=1 Tax=Cantharellus anzutake TaxID=1750568 RepID=UPI001908CD9C|nr:uncharacterized protein EI90DRAFT_1257028 [Cantharellus anzutake]KAF8330003.1 hypothetical protein EI90DRAFT_1257028 [Cantharellus anzutake]
MSESGALHPYVLHLPFPRQFHRWFHTSLERSRVVRSMAFMAEFLPRYFILFILRATEFSEDEGMLSRMSSMLMTVGATTASLPSEANRRSSWVPFPEPNENDQEAVALRYLPPAENRFAWRLGNIYVTELSSGPSPLAGSLGEWLGQPCPHPRVMRTHELRHEWEGNSAPKKPAAFRQSVSYIGTASESVDKQLRRETHASHRLRYLAKPSFHLFLPSSLFLPHLPLPLEIPVYLYG